MKEELPSNSVLAIQQTQDGYLWLGTWQGLVRFDGINFELFTNEKYPQLQGNVIRALYQDSSGVLWIGTGSGGITRYKDGEFTTFPITRHKALSRIRAINEDQWGNLWIGSSTEGLTCLSKDKFTTYSTKEGLPHNEVRSIHKDGKGNLRIVTAAGIVKILKPGIFQPCIPKGLLPHFITVCLYKEDTQELWIGTGGNGLFRLKNGKITAYGIETGIPHLTITYLYEDRLKNLWIGTDSGLARMNHGVFSTLYAGDGLGAESIYSIGEDREGNLWVGTINGGLHQLRDSKFTTYTTREGLCHDYIQGIYQSRSGHLWIGTKGGLSRLTKDNEWPNGELAAILTSGQGLLSSDNFVVCLFEDPGGYLWIGTMAGLLRFRDGNFIPFAKKDGLSGNIITCINSDSQGNILVGTEKGLNYFNYTNSQFTTIATGEGLSVNAISFILEDRRGNTWIGTEGGLNYLKNGTINPYKSSTGMENNFFRCAYEDIRGTVWFGTDRGLIRLIWQEKETQLYKYNIKCGLIENRVYSILEDKSGHLWLAGPNGISRVKKKELEDYSHGKIQRVQPDWFSEKDGMKSRWCTGGGCKTQDGRFWFPTNMGMTMIDPNHIKTNNIPPPLVIEKLIVDGESIKIKSFSGGPGGRFYKKAPLAAGGTMLVLPIHGRGVSQNSKIISNLKGDMRRKMAAGGILELTPGKKRLEFHYTAVSFINPQKIRFKLKLEGYDNDWVDMGNLRNTTYTGLSPGHYTFKVSACNSDGVWNQEGASFSFYLQSHWYKTWWAISFYIITGIFGVFFFIKRRSVKLEKEKHRLEGIVAERTYEIGSKNKQLHEQSEKLKEMDRVKSRFFANISHEFRTPLTLITGPLEQILTQYRDSDLKQKVNLMLRNSRRLLGLINQLLDLSKLDSEGMRLQASRQNIVPFIKGIVHSFDSLVFQKDLALTVHTPEESIMLFYDGEKLEKVLCNLLFNAIKFTPPGGEISVALSISREPAPGFLEISVRDTGMGIPSEQLEYIFDRFYQAEMTGPYSHKGTGIGLALAKELVTLHHGEIVAHSKEGKGSEFILRLPMGDAHLARDEIVDFTGTSRLPAKTAKNQETHGPEIEDDEYNGDSEQTDLQIHIPVPEPGSKDEVQEKDIILIVEDSADVREYIRGALEPLYLVAEARDGCEGIEKAKQIIPDLIISDIMMPGKDGYDMCKEIKSQVITSHIPVILLTARAAEENIIQGLETGADDYITKPFSTRILLARIKNLIDLRRQLQENLKREMALQPVRTAVSKIDKQFITNLQQVIEKHLADEDFNVGKLGKKLDMSGATLYRKIHALTGETPNAYIRSYRLKRAVQLLKANFGNITEVAFEVGFSSSAYFTKCFRNKFHCLPSDYLGTESTD